MKKLSVTKISTYQDCPRKFWYTYIMRIMTPKNEGFTFGTAVHAGLENYYRGKDPMQGVAQSLFGKKDNIGEESQEGVDKHKLHKEAGKMLDCYKVKAPHFEPVLVEYFFKIPLIHPETKEVLPCKFTGKMDLVTVDGKIVDHKTASRTNFGLFERRNQLQASGYGFAYLYKFGKLPKCFMYNFLVRGNTRREPSFDTKIMKITIGDLCYFFDTCKMVYGAIIRQELRYDINRSHCRFCRFKNICKYSKR